MTSLGSSEKKSGGGSGSVNEFAGNPLASVGMPGREQSTVRWIGRRRTALLVEILADKERGIESHARIGIRTCFVTAVENSVSGAHYEFAGCLVGQADARSKVVEVRRNQPRSGRSLHGNNRSQHGGQLRGHTFRHDQCAGRKIESPQLVVSFLDRGEQFVAQSQIQRKFRSDAPVVLSVKGIHLMVIVDVVQVIDAAAIAQTDQERGKPGAATELRRRIVGEAGAKVERAARSRRLKNREFFSAKIGPEFEGVTTVHPAQIFREAVSVLHFVRRQKRGTANLR